MSRPDPKLPWWTKLAWRLYTPSPPVAGDVLMWCLRYTLPFTNLRIPVAIFRGRSRCDGQLGTVVTAGAGNGMNYLIHRFFESEPQREAVSNVPVWNLARTLQRLQATADLTIARVDRLSTRFLFDAGSLAIPEGVGATLTVPEDLAMLARRNHHLKDDLRVVRRNGLTSDITHAESDFEVFYHTMYVPFIRNRHGEHAVIRNIDWLRRTFGHGGLQWIRRDGQPIAGQILQRRGPILKFVVLGKISEEWAPVKSGTTDALYFFGIQHAKELGCKLIDLGGCRPSLGDGVLRHKRKWGALLVEQPYAYYDFLVHWTRFSGPVVAFLAHTPLVFRDRSGLSAIAVVDRSEAVTRAEAAKVHHAMWMPGLRRLYLVATAGWQAGQESPPQTVLLNLADVEDCDPQKLQTLGNT